MLPEDLVTILVCPKSKQPLLYFPRGESDRDEAEGFLVSPASRLRYRIEDGVPVLLVDEAQECRTDEIERLVSRARELGLPGVE
ncbi:MAG TPA: Trm112 family protein [Kofleriaceae bacterium]